jgi:hypothetical protein
MEVMVPSGYSIFNTTSSNGRSRQLNPAPIVGLGLLALSK